MFCSKCRSEKIRRSCIRYYDLPLLFLFIPIRCLVCHARFYMFRYVEELSCFMPKPAAGA